MVEYDSKWAAKAEVELRRITKALGPLAVRLEHVGSTAVPGLAAKPVIDLQVSVVTIEPRERCVEPLERLGYLFVPQRSGEVRGAQARGRGAAPHDRLAYIAAKDRYASELEGRAVQWARTGFR
jgi:GrpB-like predicted nucleotidyltransferase (UPF0157 family)